MKELKDATFYAYVRQSGKKKWFCTGEVTVQKGSYDTCIAGVKDVFYAFGIEFESIDFGKVRTQANFLGNSENFVSKTVTLETYDHYGILARVRFYKRLCVDLADALDTVSYDPELAENLKKYW